MSEEEKKAIEHIKRWTTSMRRNERPNIIHKGDVIFCDSLDTALNLIEKQNKKIEELEKKNDVLATNYETLDLDICAVVRELGFIPEDIILSDELVPMIKENYIPKSVIREKIEELNKEFKERTQDNDSFYFDYSNEYAHIEEVLKELLGEEK